MSLTITFPNDLAQRLESEAQLRHVSVEKLAATILDQAVPRPQGTWSEKNRRRLTLIRQSLRQSLTTEEQQELDALQSTLDAWYEDFDAALESQLEMMHTILQSTVD